MTRGIIAIVDDDEAVRHSTSHFLRRSGFRTEMFKGGEDFLGRGVIEPISCILLDLRMPEMDGLAVLAALRERRASPPVIVITGHGDLAAAIDAMKLGACDFIEKPYEVDDLLAALETALGGGRTMRDANALRAIELVNNLSSQQRQVLLGILKGLQNKIIAFELKLSIRTVESYRAQLMDRLHVRGTAEAVRLAIDAGIADEPFGLARRAPLVA